MTRSVAPLVLPMWVGRSPSLSPALEPVGSIE